MIEWVKLCLRELISLHFDNTRVRIDLDAISRNFDAISQKAGVPVMAVIKADAYGHGAIQIARLLDRKCAFFGVSSMLEAMELRRAGLRTPILVLGHTPTQAFPTAIMENIRPTIYRREDALALSDAAQALGLTAYFHFAVDTGMSRIGFQVTEADADLCAGISNLPFLHAEGIFSHFATADSADLSRARAQAERFDRFCEASDEYQHLLKRVYTDSCGRLRCFGCIGISVSADRQGPSHLKPLQDFPFHVSQPLCQLHVSCISQRS